MTGESPGRVASMHSLPCLQMDLVYVQTAWPLVLAYSYRYIDNVMPWLGA